MEDYAIEVGDGLVDADGRGTVMRLASPPHSRDSAPCTHPENLSVKID